MRLGRRIKRYFRLRVPPFRGVFWYHHTHCYFPAGSIVVRRFFDTGAYEPETVEVAQSLVREGAWVFDVGAHLGMISIPLLDRHPRLRVAAFEPSPTVLPYLQRTHAEASFRERWELIPAAAGAEAGELTFYSHAPENSAYDGIADTGRGGDAKAVRIPVTTIDREWIRLGRPAVSLIKLDVEGAELTALQGAAECLAVTSPAILMEWSHLNLKAHGKTPGMLLTWAEEKGYRVFDAELLIPVTDEQTLSLRMHRSENFLLLKETTA